MSNDDEGLRQYLNPKSKYAGCEKEVRVTVQHNEGDREDDNSPDWRTDFERTYTGEEAESVMCAILWRYQAKRLRAIEDAANLFAMYAQEGFIRCKCCDAQNDTDGMDGLAELLAALEIAKAPNLTEDEWMEIRQINATK